MSSFTASQEKVPTHVLHRDAAEILGELRLAILRSIHERSRLPSRTTTSNDFNWGEQLSTATLPRSMTPLHNIAVLGQASVVKWLREVVVADGGDEEVRVPFVVVNMSITDCVFLPPEHQSLPSRLAQALHERCNIQNARCSRRRCTWRRCCGVVGDLVGLLW